MGKRSLGILVAAVLLVAACGGNSGQSNGSGPARYGGNLNIGLRADFLTLDPVRLSNDSDNSIAYGIYDPLINRVGDKGDLGPGLADSWEMSTDLKALTLHLHPNVKFHDGTPFNADAVVFNVQRHMDPKNQPIQLGDALLINSVSATDQNTAVINLKVPWVDFAQVLTGAIGYMASPTAIQKEGKDYGKQPVGTGPFVFKEWVPSDHVTAVKNKNYWISGRPYLDSVTWRPIPDQDSKFASLRAGQIDLLQVPTADQVLQAQKDKKLKVTNWNGNGGTFLIANMKQPPFDDPNARLALSYATNRKEIVDVINKGLLHQAIGTVPKDSQWYSASGEPDYDVQKAKDALAAYGKPLKFKFNIVADPITRLYGQVLQAQWQKVGIEADLVQMDQPTLILSTYGHQFQLGIYQSADWFDPDRGLFVPFYSKSGPQNFGQYVNPTVDAALVAGRSTNDVATRKQAYATVQKEMAKDQPYIYLNYNNIFTIMSTKVQNLNTMYSSVSKPGQIWLSS
jgi:ABC-type transport system substrate-binding protein